ncbi:MAG: retron St85 family effector protein [Candidatus Acidiferrales bacterium]
MNPRVIQIASQLREQYLGQPATTDISIFLCGGADGADHKLRMRLGESLAGLKSKYRYSVYYPEDMFVELVLGHQKQDLLTLENLLARSVSAVAILLQSPGTFTELGAFSNHELLKDKLVVVVDPKRKKAQSFVNSGPLRHLINETSSSVLFLKMDESNLDALVKDVAEASRKIAAAHPPDRNLTNPIACYELYLALLYVLDPVPRRAFAMVAGALEPDAEELARISAETVVNGMINNGDALLVSQNVVIAERGVETLYARAGSARRLASLKGLLSGLRISALNGQLRKRYNNFWGKAA